MEEIVALEATLYIKSCWRSTGVCESMDDIMYGERAAQGSRLICCGCEKDGNNRQTFTTKVVKSVFVVFATRGHDILYSDWRRYSIDLYIALNFLSCTVTKHTLFSYHKLSMF